ncbi:hypothetical protein Ppb6_01174 [Photorhabdus australis subsp. thailandensis]|uniref:Lipoprotein n=1 Tax=Photorhabdus australis subsp. thailandensis TaxID=2805096 RepID=A0A1C0U6K5_9GAMM|nr:hypothetical protein [Photorhabdus australis]OCQ53548.1 hypothetical protein Ppb6_01174 [Photorhabdus australis subsp. thailandensis]
MKRLAILLMGSVLLSGCTNNVPLNKQTQSGKPEGMYTNTTKEAVRDSLVAYCNEKRFMVVESSTSSVLCSKETEGGSAILTQLMIGNSYSTTPVGKIRFTIGSIGNSIKVWADMWVETQMAMGQMRQMPITDNKSRNAVQEKLDSLRP